MKTVHPNLQLCVTHLNAAVGERLSTQHLMTAMQLGSTQSLPTEAGHLISYLFVETKPELIMGCAFEANASVHQIQSLYNETLGHQLPRVPSWERAVAHWL